MSTITGDFPMTTIASSTTVATTNTIAQAEVIQAAATVTELLLMIDPVTEKTSKKDLAQTINDLKDIMMMINTKVEGLISKPVEQPKPIIEGPRRRGPKSLGVMTDRIAWEINFGMYKGQTAKYIALREGLSLGQVYSVKGGYTFRHVDKNSFTNEAASGDANEAASGDVNEAASGDANEAASGDVNEAASGDATA